MKVRDLNPFAMDLSKCYARFVKMLANYGWPHIWTVELLMLYDGPEEALSSIEDLVVEREEPLAEDIILVH